MQKLDKIWWKFVPGTEIKVCWPVGSYEKKFSHPLALNYSADPNDHYRPELERLVGVQGIDWNWKLDENNSNKLKIKFRIGKEKWASYFSLKWN